MMKEQTDVIFVLVDAVERFVWEQLSLGQFEDVRLPTLAEDGAQFELRCFLLFLLYRAFVVSKQDADASACILTGGVEITEELFAVIEPEESMDAVIDARFATYRDIDMRTADSGDVGEEVIQWGKQLARYMTAATDGKPILKNPPLVIGEFTEMFALEIALTSMIVRAVFPLLYLPVIKASDKQRNLRLLSGAGVDALLGQMLDEVKASRERPKGLLQRLFRRHQAPN